MNRMKILKLTLFAGILLTSASFAQHTHTQHSNNNTKIEKPEEELSSGLSQVKQLNNNGMQMACCKSDDKHDMAMDCCKYDEKDNPNMDCCKAGGKTMDMKNNSMDMDSGKSSKSSLVREGEIDLQGIDKNKDGKVFQDTMDWNVISDEPGECPLCGMKLKEVTLEKAKENLIKYNFKVKE